MSRSRLLLVAIATLPFASGRSQTSGDTAAIDSALLAMVVQTLRSGGDYEPPLRLPLRSDSSWLGRLYTQLRAHHPDLVAVDSVDVLDPGRPGLTLVVHVADVQPAVAEARIRWTRCTTRNSFLNYWTHGYRMTLRKGINSWLVDAPRYRSIGDGHC